jgi:Protein of unknown function (DUF2867)
VHFGTRLVDSRTQRVSALPAAAFAPIRRIGGANGWYFANVLWRMRGFLDLLVGGVGMRRGRRSAETLAVGDTLDFWRVYAFEPDRRLSLVAEMRIPGRAWAALSTGTPCIPSIDGCSLECFVQLLPERIRLR